MQFIENKYKKWYFDIIDNAKLNPKQGYVEKHHIIPRCLGGTDDPVNLINLTAREHFICHLLLTKITKGYENQLMNFALGKFIQCSPVQERKFNSWEYKKIRESISIARRGKNHSDETRQKMSAKAKGRIPWNKGKTGVVHSAESNKKRSDTLKGKSLEEKVGLDRSLEIRKKIAESKKGKSSGMLGKHHSEETKKKLSNRIVTLEQRLKISESKKGMKFSQEHLLNLSNINKINGAKKRGIPKPKITCPHCGKEGGNSLMTRYHFDNCKNKEN